MQRPSSRSLTAWLSSAPSLGDLVDLCEENYGRITRLAPELAQLPPGVYVSRLGGVLLRLEVQAQRPYTSEIRLTHVFASDSRLEQRDPDALLRVSHDARQLEVLDVRQGNLATTALYEAPGLVNKWRVNVFVAKWLAYCLVQGYRFDSRAEDQMAAKNLVTS